MLIPLRHENMQGRRWPVITIGLIALNLLIFLGTHWTMDKEGPELGEVRVHILLLAAMHPELKIDGKAQDLVTTVQTKNPSLWKEAQNQNRDVHDAWDASMRMQADEHPEAMQQEMDSLSARYAELDSTSIVSKFAFVPAHPTAMSYLSANFLHGGWLHLIGNMWFLWLAGGILEDTWGRLIYPSFYLIAGMLALQVHAVVNAGILTPTIGASGAIAGLMGAFMVRFPTVKIEMGWLMMFKFYRFKAAAYWLLPLWLLMEVFYGSLFGQASGVAHWAHVGGFVFGALAALIIGRTGLEHEANVVIEDKIGWTADPAVVQGTECLEKGNFDEGIAVLKAFLLEKPDSLDAYRMLQNIYWRKNDVPAHRGALEKVLTLEL